MKKLILFLLFPVLLQAQVQYLGVVSVDTIRYEWGNTFDSLNDFIERNKIEKTKDNKKVFFIPSMVIYPKIERAAMIVEGQLFLFAYDDESDVVTIEDVEECWLMEYSIKNKKLKKPKKYDRDTYNEIKPKNLEKKIKDKLKKLKN